MKGVRFFQSVQVKLIIIYVLLILIAMQLIGVYFVSTLKNSLTSSFTNNLKQQAELLAGFVASLSSSPEETKGDGKKTNEDLNNVVNLFNISGGEIQILDGNGKVLYTSLQAHSSYINQKNTQIVVSRALQGIKDNEGIIDEDGVRKKVIATPVVSSPGKIIGAVYIAASMKDLYDTMERINEIFITGILFALVLTAVLGIILAHTITNPIKEITKQATAVADGRFDQQVKILGNDEIGQLGEAFNHMTARLREALSLNEEENEKLASVLSNMSDGVIATDERGTVIVLNRRAMQMLHIDETAVGGDIGELLDLPPEQVQQYMADTEQTVYISLDIPERGEEWIARVTFTPVHRRGQGITGIIAVLQDVTEQEKLEQSRREFVANVSHELRTPLTTIKSYAEALEDGALEDEQLGQRFVGVIRNETERMIRLVTDLLHLSRLDSKQAILRMRKTGVTEMLEEVADRFSFQMRQKSIRNRIVIESGVESIVLDRDQIDQVLDNLVSNAIKYTPEGGSIEMRARAMGQAMVQISIQDTGIGIPKNDLARIFERFYRVDKARSRNMGGTGLGLSIAREIIKAHGGSIEIESELNEGTRVAFTLPVQVEGSEAG